MSGDTLTLACVAYAIGWGVVGVWFGSSLRRRRSR